MKTQLLAKAKVASVTDYGNSNKGAKLTAVSGDSEENKTFSQYTPNLELSILVNNPDALDFFNAGEEIYITMSKEPVKDLELINLLLSVYLLGYEQFNETNTFKVIEWRLMDFGIKVFRLQKDNEVKICAIDFIKTQFPEPEVMQIECLPRLTKLDFENANIKIERIL